MAEPKFRSSRYVPNAPHRSRRGGAPDGVAIDDATIDRLIDLGRAQAADSYSSLHADLVNGSRIELEALHGEVVRRAAMHGVEVPACRAVYAILRPWLRIGQGRFGQTPTSGST